MITPKFILTFGKIIHFLIQDKLPTVINYISCCFLDFNEELLIKNIVFDMIETCSNIFKKLFPFYSLL